MRSAGMAGRWLLAGGLLLLGLLLSGFGCPASMPDHLPARAAARAAAAQQALQRREATTAEQTANPQPTLPLLAALALALPAPIRPAPPAEQPAASIHFRAATWFLPNLLRRPPPPSTLS